MPGQGFLQAHGPGQGQAFGGDVRDGDLAGAGVTGHGDRDQHGTGGRPHLQIGRQAPFSRIRAGRHA